MDAMAWLSIIGVAVSIAGALISLWQARNSKSAAEEAKRVQKQLIDHRSTSELSQLQTVCKKAQRSMEKYGPGSATSSLRGIKPEKDADDVQEFLLLINENKAHFENHITKGNEADEFYRKMTPALDRFAQSKTPDDLRLHGKEVLLMLNSMTSVIKANLESKRESIH